MPSIVICAPPRDQLAWDVVSRVLADERGLNSFFAPTTSLAYDLVCEHLPAVLVADLLAPGGDVLGLMKAAHERQRLALILALRGDQVYHNSIILTPQPINLVNPLGDLLAAADLIAGAVPPEG